jgi:hypothetical protein
MQFVFGLIVGVLVGGLLVIVFSKNNKNHIAAARNEVLETIDKAEAAIKKRGRKKSE